MIWKIEWEDEAIVFGFDFAEILHEGIEGGMDEVLHVAENGSDCDRCGEWRICFETAVETIGGEPDEKLIMSHNLCMKCRREVPHLPTF